MVIRIRNYALIALAAGAFYYLLSHHFIFRSISDFDVLEKTELTLEYTFISSKQTSLAKLLRIEPLRDAGLGELYLERGAISETKLDALLDQIDAEYESED